MEQVHEKQVEKHIIFFVLALKTELVVLRRVGVYIIMGFFLFKSHYSL